jgi:hypothetical protein
MRRQIKITVIFTILTFALTSFTSNQDEPAIDFPESVDSFIKKYSADFSEVPQTHNLESNDFVLDNKVITTWNKTVTLKRKKSFKNKYDQTVYQRLFLGFYQYDTEKQCSAALDSLLNCFGTDCCKIKWGDNIKGFKTTPRVYLINEKTIITCKIYCEHVDNFWITFKHDLIMTFGNESSIIIDAGCGGPINFRKF